MVEQLSLSFESSSRLEVGDIVEVVARPNENQDIELRSYLEIYTGMKGKLVRILRDKVVCYEVDFNSKKLRNGVFYEHHLRKL